MNHPWRAALAILALPLASCGRQGPLLYPVVGSVVYKGQPASGATVIFRREGGESSSPTNEIPLSVGQVDEQGKFSLISGDWGEGAPTGIYKVLIQWNTRADLPDAPRSDAKTKSRSRVVVEKPDGIPDRLEGRYMKPDGIGLRAEVKPGQNDLPPFDVSK